MRVFALVLGPVRTRADDSGDPDQISAEQVGAMTVAISAAGQTGGQEIRRRDQAEARADLARLTA